MTPETYLDHAASTPLRPEARRAWLDAVATHHANPTGAHAAARRARRALDAARADVAAALGRTPGEIVFTSGGSESDNLAIRGVTARRAGTVVCSAGEHHAVLEPVLELGGRTVPLTRHGTIDLDALADTLEHLDEVALVSVMTVNNETGAVNDIEAVARIVHRCAPGALVHTDAVQAVPWIDVARVTATADLVSVTAHKIGGPVGVGALVVGDGVDLAPLVSGGGQERGRRAGTPAVALAAAFAAALDVTTDRRDDEVARLESLRDHLIDGLVGALGDRLLVTAAPDGSRRHLVAGIAHVCLAGVDSEALLFLLDEAGVRASAASSCSSGAQRASHVLTAMGVGPDRARSSLRLSLGHTSTADDVERGVAAVVDAVRRLDRHGGG